MQVVLMAVVALLAAGVPPRRVGAPPTSARLQALLPGIPDSLLRAAEVAAETTVVVLRFILMEGMGVRWVKTPPTAVAAAEGDRLEALRRKAEQRTAPLTIVAHLARKVREVIALHCLVAVVVEVCMVEAALRLKAVEEALAT